jgi:ubiquinone biosynthesis monooxygenase Coq7
MPDRSPRPAAPGDGLDARLAEMIRVDHAGEYGAVQIYRGQRAVFEAMGRHPHLVSALRRQEADEAAHLKAFDALIAQRGVRPTALAPIWNAAGFALGAVTALMGEKAAHACTAAVETAIEGHYAEQEAELGAREPELKAMIAQFRAEETAHKDEAIAEGAREAPGFSVLDAVIKAGCRVAIAVSQKI